MSDEWFCCDVWEQELVNVHTCALETKSCSKKVTSYFTKETRTDECKHIATKEGLFAFHTIKHNHSFRSMD
jgi:hypothetical protein